MTFPVHFLDEIRARVALAQVIGQSVKLTRKGREYSGLCPFHNEKSPSFTVNEDKGFFHCFGCGAHGDVITFLMRARHMSFPDAVEQLAGQAGLDLPEQTPQDREREKRAAGLHDITEAAAAWFEEQLWKPSGKVALDYLHDRGLSDDTIRRFRLGWSPENRTGLKTALKAMGRSSQGSVRSEERTEWSGGEMLAVEAGLLIKPEEGGDSFDRFRGRVMFPIADRRGRVIAFGGRIMGDGQPKYLNSPDTPLFHKGHNLYGWALAREEAAKTGTVLVAEGYMDVIALHQAGFGNAVAPLGTAVTEEQIELMWREVAEPILCLDGDAAGQRAAIRAAERALTILKPGRSLRFATLPAPEDPDSLIKKSGRAAMQAVCDQAIPLSDTLWRVKFQNLPLATPEQRAGVELQIKQVLGVIPDQGLQRDYIFDFVRRLREASRPPPRQRTPWQPSSFGGGRGGPQKPPPARTYTTRDAQGKVVVAGRKPSPLPKPAGEIQERLLLLTPLAHPALIDEVAERLGEVMFADSSLDKLRQEVLIHAHDFASLDREAVHDYLRSRGFSQTLDCLLEASAHDYTRLIKPDISLEEVRRAWEHVYGRYRRKDWAADVEQALQRSAADLTDETFGFFNALWSGRDHNGDL
jgi:DNA primase